MWLLLNGLLWATTFVMAPTWANGFWTPKAMLWLVGSFLLASSHWWNAPSQPTKTNRWLGYLFCWMILSFGWHVLWPQVHIANTMARTIPMPWVWFPILPTLIALGSFLAMDALIRHTDRLERWIAVAETLCWIGGVLSVYAIAQWCWLDPFQMAQHMSAGFIEKNYPITTFGNHMLTANMLALCIPFCLMFRPLRFKVLYGLMAGNLLWMLHTASPSSSSIIAALAGTLCFFLCIRAWRKVLVTLLVLGLGAFWLLSYHQGGGFLNPHGRLEFWQQLLTMWKQSAPWMGVGLGGVEYASSQGVWNWASAHNEPIQILFELGLVGLALTGLALGTTLRRVARQPMSISLAGWISGAVSFAIISCLSFPLRIAPMLAIGVCIWAALEAHTGGTYATTQVPA